MLKKISLCLLFCSSVVSATTELTVYTSIENERLQAYKSAFESENPDIKIKWVRDSTGVITARLIAEKDNPQADIIFGVGTSSLLFLADKDILDSYEPAGIEFIDSSMKDSSSPPKWVGIDSWSSALCINHILLEKENLPMPKSWKDLTNPIYKGKIAMANPASSGTGYMGVTAWLQLFGEYQGWEYMDKLDPNIKAYVHSGTKPCSMAAQGEVVIGISSASFVEGLIRRRAPLTVVYPEEGLGWETEAVAIVKGTGQREAAEKLMDFSSSEKVASLGVEFSELPARKDFMTAQGRILFNKLIPNDLKWAAENRDGILKEWQSRYE